jgi:hypothetical protein
MNITERFRLALSLVLAVGGCGAGEVATQGPESQEAIVADNGVFLSNGLNLPNGFLLSNGVQITNGLKLSNGIDLSNGINLSNGVTAPDGIVGPYIFVPSGSDLEKWIDENPTMKLKILKYLVGCALNSTQTVRLKYRGTLYNFYGLAGLGPSIQSGVMTVADQESVSSCLLARVNGRGWSVLIDLTGPDSPISGKISCSDYNAIGPQMRIEGTFFGNLFLPSPKAYVCLADPLFIGWGDSTWLRISNASGSTGIATYIGICEYGYTLTMDTLGLYHTCGTSGYLTAGYTYAVAATLKTSWGDSHTYTHPITTYYDGYPPGTPCSCGTSATTSICNNYLCRYDFCEKGAAGYVCSN